MMDAKMTTALRAYCSAMGDTSPEGMVEWVLSYLSDQEKWNTQYIDIVFDGPPSHKAGRFVEVENDKGSGVSAGEWMQRTDGYWVLRIPIVHESASDELKTLLQNTGDRIADILEQKVRGQQIDALQHEENMVSLAQALMAIGEYRAKHLGYPDLLPATKESDHD